MTYTSATRLIKCELQKKQEKWMDFIDGGKGYLFGIPSNAHKVVQFKVEEKSIKEIGPDLGNEQWKYKNGVKAGNGSIYCLPHYAKYILKITPRDGQDADVQVLKDKQLPIGRWGNGALAKDGCIYYFPCNGKRILRLDPNKGDSLSLVGREIRNGFAAVVSAVDGCIYGISSRRVFKYNPVKKRVSQVGKDFDGHHFFDGAVLAENGNIYSANLYGQMLQVDTANNDWKIIGKRVHNGKGRGWGRPVLGADKCIYFPPACHAPSCNDRVLKFNQAHTQYR